MSQEQLRETDSVASVEDLSADTVFDLLSHAQRRALVISLQRSEEPLAVTDAAKEVVWRNSNRSMGEITAEEVENVVVQLYHRHVPKLAEWGAVSLDTEYNTVKLTERGKKLATVQAELGSLGIDDC